VELYRGENMVYDGKKAAKWLEKELSTVEAEIEAIIVEFRGSRQEEIMEAYTKKITNGDFDDRKQQS